MSASRTKSKKMRQKTHRYTSNVFSMFNQAQIQEFKEAFNMIDQNRDGFVDKEDLIEMMTSLGKNPSDDFLDAMIQEAPGPINFTMFLTLFGEKLNGTDPEDVIKNAFACFDPKDIGYIDEEKLRECMTTMGDRWTNEMVDELFSTAPICSGNFEYNEFIHTLKHGNKKDEDEGAAAARNNPPQSPKPAAEEDVPPPTSKLAAAAQAEKPITRKKSAKSTAGAAKDVDDKRGPPKSSLKSAPKPLKSSFKK